MLSKEEIAEARDLALSIADQFGNWLSDDDLVTKVEEHKAEPSKEFLRYVAKVYKIKGESQSSFSAADVNRIWDPRKYD